MPKKKNNWKSLALAAINKVYPNATDRTKQNLLANIAHETGNGAYSTEGAMKWKNLEGRTDLPTIKGKINAYMEKNNLSKKDYDKLPASSRISIQYQGDTGHPLSGGIGALQTTDVSGSKIKEMRAVGRELGYKNDKAILRYVAKNMYNSAVYSLSVMKKRGITAEKLNSQKTALDLRKKYINPGETSAKHLASVSNYEKQIQEEYSQLQPIDEENIKDVNVGEPDYENVTEAESYTVYSKLRKELQEEDKRYNNGKDGASQKTHDDNIYAIKEKYQREYGEENIRKGLEIFNEEQKYVFENENKHYKKLSKLNEEYEKLIRKEALGNLNDSDRKKIESYKSQRKAIFANIKLDKNKLDLKQQQSIINTADVNSIEFKNAKRISNELKKSIGEIESGFSKNKINSFSPLPGTGATVKTGNNDIDYSNYDGDINEDISGNYVIDTYQAVEVDYDIPTDYINDEQIEDNANNEGVVEDETEDEYDFVSQLNKNGFQSDDPYNFTDDVHEEQSAKGFLKNNPTSILSAALGIKGFVDSQSEIPSMEINDKTALSESFYEYLNNLETISKQGFTPEEEANHLKKINDGYMASVDVAVRASGGNRAQVLAQAGGLNANKNSALLEFSSQDAQLHRENLEKYGQALEYKEAFNERKDIRVQTNNYREKAADFDQALQKRQGGAALAASSISSLVNSINDYKETGPGSALSKYMDYMNKKLESEGTRFNTATGKNFKNQEEWDAYKKSELDLDKSLRVAAAKFQPLFNNDKSQTKEDKKAIYERLKSSDRKTQLNYFEQFNPSDGIKGLDFIDLKNESNFDLPIEENKFNIDQYGGLYS